MKNAHIKPGQLVPAELRLEIYKEAKRSIETNTNISNDIQMLCVCILWDLKEYFHNSPSGKRWSVYHSQIMFPEFGKGINVLNGKPKALDELTKVIEALEKETEKPKAISKVVVVGTGQESILYNISTRINDNLNELPFDAALDVYNQIRERMRERLAEEMNAPEERINYLKSIEL